MNYKETVEYLYSAVPMFQKIGKAAYKGDLRNSLAFDELLECPHKAYKTIHVAGTNGKGSVSHMLASVYQSAGYKTGLYTSPHLLDFRERIRVNGEMVTEAFVIDFVKKHKLFIEELSPSFFEITVAMAFSYFKEQKVDVAIIETGLGGRLDSTNIITPIASVITNIGLDHTQYLGDTLEKIATEKAGIIKENIPVIIGEEQIHSKPIFISKAKEKDAPIVFAEELFNVSTTTQLVNGKTKHYLKENLLGIESIDCDVTGNYQKKNLQCALGVLYACNKHLNVTTESILDGLAAVTEKTGLLGRWMILDLNPQVICDTGHNYEGLQEISTHLKNMAYKNLHLILGFSDDKDVLRIIKLFPDEAKFYFTESSVPRTKKVEEIKKNNSLVDESVHYFKSVKQAFNYVKDIADENDLVFVGGSTFIVADLLKNQKKQ